MKCSTVHEGVVRARRNTQIHARSESLPSSLLRFPSLDSVSEDIIRLQHIHSECLPREGVCAVAQQVSHDGGAIHTQPRWQHHRILHDTVGYRVRELVGYLAHLSIRHFTRLHCQCYPLSQCFQLIGLVIPKERQSPQNLNAQPSILVTPFLGPDTRCL